jgi:dihydrolipoamide dehydrogenase
LLLSAEVYDYVKNAKEFGIIAKDVSVDWQAIIARKTKVVTKLAKGVEFLLKKNKVEMIRGFAKLAGPGKISVTDPKGATQEISAKNIVLATGSEARMLPGLEADGKTLLTNKEILSLPAIPQIDGHHRRGRGGRGIRFHLPALRNQGHRAGNVAAGGAAGRRGDFRRAGEIAEAPGHRHSDPSQGCESYKDRDRHYAGIHGRQDGKPQTMEAETCLVAVGRVPNTANIGLEKTRVKLERGFVKTDGLSCRPMSPASTPSATSWPTARCWRTSLPWKASWPLLMRRANTRKPSTIGRFPIAPIRSRKWQRGIDGAPGA